MNKKLLLISVLCISHSDILLAKTSDINRLSQNMPSHTYIAILIVLLLLITYLVHKNMKMSVLNQRLHVQNQKRLEQYSKADKQKEALADINQAQEDVMSSVAHDLKAPLNRVYGLVDVVFINDENLTPEQKKYLQLVQQVASEARNMIQNWLDVKAIESQKIQIAYQEINIRDFVQDLLIGYQDAAHKKGISLQISIDIQQNTFMTDNNLLNRILDNLLSNAIKFSPLNGTVKFKVKEDIHWMTFSVEDQGVGISESEKDKLFEKFQKLSARPTAGESSTGLGLSIVKTLVQSLRGEIQVDSIVGEGSVFSITLPKTDYRKISEVTFIEPKTSVFD